MPNSRSCIVREETIAREYRVAPPERWEHNVSPGAARQKPNGRSRSRKSFRTRRRRSGFLPLVLMGLTLFACGFLLGNVLAADSIPAQSGLDAVSSTAQGEKQNPVRYFGIIGASTGTSGGTAGENGGSGQTEDWMLRLVNAENPLPEEFTVPELTQLKNGHAIDRRAYPELQAMMDAARAEGYQPLICSSYRSWDKQSELFRNKTQKYINQGSSKEDAEEQAAYWVARPGTSEHQVGLAVDIVDKEYQLLDRAQENRPVQQWLMAHCAEYGFILRYPTEKSEVTGIGYEPWHYRYVGKEAAQAIMSAGICLEEYLNP